ncbi:MAG: cobalamin-dependent protein [Deltaproteobacteria bacterium]|nr:cobalamin-dependent protein [Deltaproteobacteria bacterium]MBW2421057.1 cobalamin-dependent protein [Deltaproteobacteria bacterium]
MSSHEVAQLILAVDETATEAVEKALAAGADPVGLLQDGVIEGLRLIGEKFEEGEYFLTELIMGGQIAEACIALVDPHLPEGAGEPRGVVVIGAVQGDMHDLGYGLVAMQLKLSGFEVHELGVDIAPMAFIDKAEEVGADIIGLSAFLVTTIPNCAEVVKYVRDMGLQERFKVIVGGGPTDQKLADEIGADGWAANAVEAVSLCESLVEEPARATAG